MVERKSRVASIGNVCIGGNHPVAVQTMWDDRLPSWPSTEYDLLLETVRKYSTMGCSIMRFSYPSADDHVVFSKLCRDSPVPIVADIHYDWRLALDALDCGAAKIRINPGNIGARWKVEEVVRAAKDRGAAIRIGLNGGSLPRIVRNRDHADTMVETALQYIEWFESCSFDNIVVSLKDTDCEITYRANKRISELMHYPLHLGVTEAGGIVTAVARSTWILGRLLSEGIGDTIRISISDDRIYEILAAREILRVSGLEPGGVRIISCPRCGRSTFDSQSFLKQVQENLMQSDKNLTIAIMGCQVNGPGEASHADLAVTGIGSKIFLYKKGILDRELERESAGLELAKELEAWTNA